MTDFIINGVADADAEAALRTLVSACMARRKFVPRRNLNRISRLLRTKSQCSRPWCRRWRVSKRRSSSLVTAVWAVIGRYWRALCFNAT